MKRVRLSWTACGSCSHPEIMTRRDGSLCAVDFPAMVGIIRHPDAGLIVFDTGYDAAFLSATDPFPERLYRWATPVRMDAGENAADWLTRHGHDCADVGAVVLSHFHGDHIAGLHNFPNARIFCAEAGLATLRSASRFGRVAKGLLAALVPADIAARAKFFESLPRTPLPAEFAPFETGVDLLGDGALLAIELPGHCPGHWGIALRLEDDRYVFMLGDAAWSIGAVERATPPPWITTSLLGDTRRYRQTLQLMHETRTRNPDLVMLPSHCMKAARALGPDAD